MNTYTLVLSKTRIISLVSVHTMWCATAIILQLLLVLLTVTVESANIREVSGVQKREGDSSIAADLNKVTPPSIGGKINNTLSTTSVSTTGPVPAQDTKVQEKVNCSLEANNVNKTICPNSNNSDDADGYFNSLKKKMIDNKDMLLRTLYVTLGITGIIVVYFVARTVWLRNRRTKSRKYRIIAQNGDQRDLEMEPLGDGNDDDEDYTVFELNGRKK